MIATKRGSLHTKTFELMQEAKLDLLIVFKETGLPYHWLKKFFYNEVKNPSVNRVQILYEYLSGKKLKL